MRNLRPVEIFYRIMFGCGIYMLLSALFILMFYFTGVPLNITNWKTFLGSLSTFSGLSYVLYSRMKIAAKFPLNYILLFFESFAYAIMVASLSTDSFDLAFACYF